MCDPWSPDLVFVLPREERFVRVTKTLQIRRNHPVRSAQASKLSWRMGQQLFGIRFIIIMEHIIKKNHLASTPKQIYHFPTIHLASPPVPKVREVVEKQNKLLSPRSIFHIVIFCSLEFRKIDPFCAWFLILTTLILTKRWSYPPVSWHRDGPTDPYIHIEIVLLTLILT